MCDAVKGPAQREVFNKISKAGLDPSTLNELGVTPAKLAAAKCQTKKKIKEKKKSKYPNTKKKKPNKMQSNSDDDGSTATISKPFPAGVTRQKTWVEIEDKCEEFFLQLRKIRCKI